MQRPSRLAIQYMAPSRSLSSGRPDGRLRPDPVARPRNDGNKC